MPQKSLTGIVLLLLIIAVEVVIVAVLLYRAYGNWLPQFLVVLIVVALIGLIMGNLERWA